MSVSKTNDEKKKNTEIMLEAYEPTGYTLLIEMLDVTKSCTYHGKEVDYNTGMTLGDFPLVIPSEVLNKEQSAETVGQTYGYVRKIGPDAYTRMHFEPNEKWAKVGDLVRMAQYGGENIRTPNYKETSLRVINDADVLGTLDTKALKKAGLLDDIKIELDS